MTAGGDEGTKYMARFVNRLWLFLDVPAGSIMGVYSGTMIVLTVVGFFLKRGFQDGAVAAYTAALTAFAVHRTFGKNAVQTNSSLPVQEGTHGE